MTPNDRTERVLGVVLGLFMLMGAGIVIAGLLGY